MNIVISASEWISCASLALSGCQETASKELDAPKLEDEKKKSHLLAGNILNEDRVGDAGLGKREVMDCELRHGVDSRAVDYADADFSGESELFFMSGISSKEEARREASIIFCYCLNIDKIQLRLKEDFLVTEEQYMQLSNSLERRMCGEPIAYIFGQKEFFGIDFMVNEHTLIPRPETEFLVEEVLVYGGDNSCSFLDLGCGTGCIALSVLKNRPKWQAVLVDISPDALDVARENAVRLGVEGRAHFMLGDFSCENFQQELSRLCDALYNDSGFCFFQDKKESLSLDSVYRERHLFDVIVSNPPYIPIEEYQQLHLSVKDYEPETALVSGDCARNMQVNDFNKNLEAEIDITLVNKGLYHVKKVIDLAEEMLKPHGLLLIEHGYNQAQDCRDLCDTKKWESVGSGKDYGGIERYMKAFRKSISSS